MQVSLSNEMKTTSMKLFKTLFFRSEEKEKGWNLMSKLTFTEMGIINQREFVDGDMGESSSKLQIVANLQISYPNWSKDFFSVTFYRMQCI